MPEDIRKRKLLVVSDTPFYNSGQGLLAFEPVVRELESLLNVFDEIVWLGCMVSQQQHAMVLPKEGIRLVSMPSVSNTAMNALHVLYAYPVFFYKILAHLKGVTHVHARGPSHPALLLMPIAAIDTRRKYWHKYAGNWAVKSGAFSYRLQQRILKKGFGTNSTVTINGVYDDSPSHIVAFENPCLTEFERQRANSKANEKKFSGDLELLFVGGLNANKGIQELVASIAENKFPSRIKAIHIVGDGPQRPSIVDALKSTLRANVLIHGYLKRREVERFYERCHMLILPSRSEGFPKVIAEASAYGCIPVVTEVSCIPQYIHHGENGFLLKTGSPDDIACTLSEVCGSSKLPEISRAATQLTTKFTYEYYLKRIKSEIFCLD